MNDAKTADRSSAEEQQTRETETQRGVTRWLIREILGVVFVAVTLFVSAGRLDWVVGWALVGLYATWVGATALIMIPRDPELLAERASRKKDIAAWDTRLMSIIGLLTLAKYIVAGLDQRFGWTAPMPPVLQITAMAIAALGYALGIWAMAANAYFSLVYRIQDDRGHAVAAGGPYRYMRHPAYLGTIAFELATPIMLGSLWALIPGGLAALLFALRAYLEDRSLQGELDGYAEYAQRVRYRLLPGVW